VKVFCSITVGAAKRDQFFFYVNRLYVALPTAVPCPLDEFPLAGNSKRLHVTKFHRPEMNLVSSLLYSNKLEKHASLKYTLNKKFQLTKLEKHETASRQKVLF
jgi:hypothetical protein